MLQSLGEEKSMPEMTSKNSSFKARVNSEGVENIGATNSPSEFQATKRRFSASDADHNPERSEDKKPTRRSSLIFAQLEPHISFFAKAEKDRAAALQEQNIPMELEMPPKAIEAATQQQEPQTSLPLSLNPRLRFRDGSIPIFYKEGNPVVLKIIKMRELYLEPDANSLFLEDGYLPVLPSYAGLRLVALPNNKWAIKDGITNKLMDPEPDKSYAFVTMPDKSIRIMPAGEKMHLLASNMSPAVRFAGNVIFNKQQEITSYNGLSGAFRPSDDLAHQAGFNPSDLAKFRKYEDAKKDEAANKRMALSQINSTIDVPNTIAMIR
jgi:hypothetical protein